MIVRNLPKRVLNKLHIQLSLHSYVNNLENEIGTNNSTNWPIKIFHTFWIIVISSLQVNIVNDRLL